MAIWSLYRVVEFATQGIKRSPPFVARDHHARALRCRAVGSTLRTKTRAIVTTQWGLRHRKQDRFADREGEIDLVADDWLGLAQRVTRRITAVMGSDVHPTRERFVDLGGDHARDGTQATATH
jgi:hypothetical protein